MVDCSAPTMRIIALFPFDVDILQGVVKETSIIKLDKIGMSR
jgi:hypothetical protein